GGGVAPGATRRADQETGLYGPAAGRIGDGGRMVAFALERAGEHDGSRYEHERDASHAYPPLVEPRSIARGAREAKHSSSTIGRREAAAPRLGRGMRFRYVRHADVARRPPPAPLPAPGELRPPDRRGGGGDDPHRRPRTAGSPGALPHLPAREDRRGRGRSPDASR